MVCEQIGIEKWTASYLYMFPLLNQTNLCNICDVNRFALTQNSWRNFWRTCSSSVHPLIATCFITIISAFPQNAYMLANKMSSSGLGRAFVPQCGMLRSRSHTACRVSWPVSNPTVKPWSQSALGLRLAPPPYRRSLAFHLLSQGQQRGKCVLHTLIE